MLSKNYVIYEELISIKNLKNSIIKTKIPIAKQKWIKLRNGLVSQKYKPRKTFSLIDQVIQNVILARFKFVLKKNINCWDILRWIKAKWKNIAWIVKINIKTFFSSLNYQILLQKLNLYCDQATKELIYKIFKAECFNTYNLKNQKIANYNKISSIISSIYFNSVDKYITDKLLLSYNKKKYCMKNLTFIKNYIFLALTVKIMYKYNSVRKVLLKIKCNKFIKNNTFIFNKNFDSSFKRCSYIRHTNTFIVSFVGFYQESQEIFRLINCMLKSLKLRINKKTSAIHCSNEPEIQFLNVSIRFFNVSMLWRKKKTKQVLALKVKKINNIWFFIPIKQIIQECVIRNLMKSQKNYKFQEIKSLKYSSLKNIKIVEMYLTFFKSILDCFFYFCKQIKLWKILAVLQKSCALTLILKPKIKYLFKII